MMRPATILTNGDQHGGHGVALRESDCAVHGAVEVGFAANPVAAFPRLALVDDAGVEVGVDGHLPSGHGVEGEPRRDFRDADRAVVDDDVLNRDQDQEHDDADDEAAADDELAEGHDDVARRFDAVGAMEQHEACRGHLQRQADEREQQEQRGKHRKRHRLLDIDRRQQQHHREPDVEREHQIEQQRRQRHDHRQNDGNHRAGREQLRER